MSKLEKDLAKAQAAQRYTELIDQVIKSLPAETKYYKAREMARKLKVEILGAACEEKVS